MSLCLLVACTEDDGESEASEGAQHNTTEVILPDQDELIKRLKDAYEALKAKEWRPYLALRSEAALGNHGATLEHILSLEDQSVATMAALVLEDQLVSQGASQALIDKARPLLQSILTEGELLETKPLAIRILGRLPRASSQDLLLTLHEAESNATLRDMLLSALGDNADQAGIEAIKARFASMSSCAESRHATLATRRADDALATPQSRTWLESIASPKLVECADERAEAGEPPDADLSALVRAHDQAAATTLIHKVLLADVGRTLKLRALAMIMESGDSQAGTLLNASLKELAAQGLATETLMVVNTLRGL